MGAEEEPRLSPNARRLLIAAYEAAHRAGDHEIGPEHLLEALRAGTARKSNLFLIDDLMAGRSIQAQIAPLAEAEGKPYNEKLRRILKSAQLVAKTGMVEPHHIWIAVQQHGVPVDRVRMSELDTRAMEGSPQEFYTIADIDTLQAEIWDRVKAAGPLYLLAEAAPSEPKFGPCSLYNDEFISRSVCYGLPLPEGRPYVLLYTSERSWTGWEGELSYLVSRVAADRGLRSSRSRRLPEVSEEIELIFRDQKYRLPTYRLGNVWAVRRTLQREVMTLVASDWFVQPLTLSYASI